MQIKRRLITVNFVTPKINSWLLFFLNLSFDSPSMNQSFHHEHKRTTSHASSSVSGAEWLLTLVSGTTGGPWGSDATCNRGGSHLITSANPGTRGWRISGSLNHKSQPWAAAHITLIYFTDSVGAPELILTHGSSNPVARGVSNLIAPLSLAINCRDVPNFSSNASWQATAGGRSDQCDVTSRKQMFYRFLLHHFNPGASCVRDARGHRHSKKLFRHEAEMNSRGDDGLRCVENEPRRGTRGHKVSGEAQGMFL